MASDDDITVSGKQYPQNPGFVERVKEGFMPTDQRAQLEAIRRVRSRPIKTFSSNIDTKGDGS